MKAKKHQFPFEAVAPTTPEQRSLLNRYPLFFRAARYPGTHPCNLGIWGIACGPGWYPLVEQAATVIENELRQCLRQLTIADTLTSVERRMQNIPASEALGDLGWETHPDALIPFCAEISKRKDELYIHITAGYLEDSTVLSRMRLAAVTAQGLAKSVCELCGASGRSNFFNEYVYCAKCDPVKISSLNSRTQTRT